MGLFKWFKQNQPQPQTVDTANSGNGQNDIPRDLFIEERDPQEHAPTYSANGGAKGIEAVYAFLLTDFEPKGYNDAIVNEDQSNKESGIKGIKLSLEIIIDREIHALNKHIKDVECEIQTRKDAGFPDLVRVLETKKQQAEQDINKIEDVKRQMNSNSGLFEKVLLSYEQGFKRGLAAITKSKFQ